MSPGFARDVFECIPSMGDDTIIDQHDVARVKFLVKATHLIELVVEAVHRNFQKCRDIPVQFAMSCLDPVWNEQ